MGFGAFVALLTLVLIVVPATRSGKNRSSAPTKRASVQSGSAPQPREAWLSNDLQRMIQALNSEGKLSDRHFLDGCELTLRIAMFLPRLSKRSLGWQVGNDLARQFRELGHEFELISCAGDALQDRPGSTVLSTSRLWEWVDRVLVPLSRCPWLISSAMAFASYLREHGDAHDLLYLEVAYPHASAGALGAALAGWKGPLVIKPAGEDTLVIEDASYGFRRFWLPRVLARWTLRRAAALCVVSPLIEPYLVEQAPAPMRQIIPANVSRGTVAAARVGDDESRRCRREARATLDDAHGTHGKTVVLSVGRLHPFKGLDLLIAAMRSLPHHHLMIAGPSFSIRGLGDVADSLRREAEHQGVAERVQLLGAIDADRVLNLMAAADVVVVPSRLESLNKVCVEAAAVGTPCVVTETTGISHWLPTPTVGRVVPPNNPEAIAAAVQELTAGDSPFSRPHARVFVERFAPERVAAETAALCQSVMSTKPE